MRLGVIVAFVGIVCGLVYFVFSHPGLDRLEELEREHRSLQAQNEALAAQNEDLEQQILALRDDPRLAERRARETVGLARPEELIFQFARPRKERTVRVRLTATSDSLEVAGEAVELAGLEQALRALHEEIPDARLAVSIADEVTPIERQRILDIVSASALGEQGWEKEVP